MGRRGLRRLLGERVEDEKEGAHQGFSTRQGFRCWETGCHSPGDRAQESDPSLDDDCRVCGMWGLWGPSIGSYSVGAIRIQEESVEGTT